MITLSDKKRLLENFSALSLMQILNYVLPFVTLPYLARVLSIEGYGIYLFSQAFIQYFIVIVDFGFDLSATRQISLNRDNKNKISEIVSSVLAVKILLALVSFTLLVLLLIFFQPLRENWQVHLLSFGMVLGNIFFSIYFYQGLEKMKFITIFNASIKIFFTFAIFIFVQEPSDLPIVPLINSLGYCVVGIVSLMVIINIFKVKLIVPRYSDVILQAKNSAQFFWSRVAVSLYTTSNTFVIGLILGPTAAGIFGSADKLFRGIVSLYQPLNNVLYPYIAHSKNINLYKKLFKIATLSNIVIIAVTIFFTEVIIQLVFGEGFEESAVLLRLLLIAALYLMPSILLGYPLLGALGYAKIVNNSVICASIIHIGLLIISIPFLTLQLIVIYIILTELFVFGYRIYYVKKYSLLKIH